MSVGFVTDDKWLLQKGKIDKDDRRVLKEAGKGGEVVRMSTRQMLETMQKDEPEKFRQFKENQEKQWGRQLTLEDIQELSRQGSDKFQAYEAAFRDWMTENQALVVRQWRVNEHRSWRSVARCAWERVKRRQWPGWKLWSPPSNQIAGMALCSVAARTLGGDYRKEPWN